MTCVLTAYNRNTGTACVVMLQAQSWRLSNQKASSKKVEFALRVWYTLVLELTVESRHTSLGCVTRNAVLAFPTLS